MGVRGTLFQGVSASLLEELHTESRERPPCADTAAGSTVTPVNWERLVAALRAGKMPDWDVYDSVTSSAISPLSEKSVAGGSAPVPFPDFTKGKWQTAKPYDVV